MTKTQIIAKTILTVLGIYAVVTLYQFYPGQYVCSREEPHILREILSLSVFTVFVVLVAYFMSFKNNWLASKITGPGEQLTQQTQMVWLIKSLRIGLVFAGLMLLGRSLPTIMKISKTFFLIGSAFDDIAIYKSIPKVLILSYPEWFRHIYNFLKAILALYLICGAPHFIRWQVKHSPHYELGKVQT